MVLRASIGHVLAREIAEQLAAAEMELEVDRRGTAGAVCDGVLEVIADRLNPALALGIGGIDFRIPCQEEIFILLVFARFLGQDLVLAAAAVEESAVEDKAIVRRLELAGPEALAEGASRLPHLVAPSVRVVLGGVVQAVVPPRLRSQLDPAIAHDAAFAAGESNLVQLPAQAGQAADPAAECLSERIRSASQGLFSRSALRRP